MTVSTEMRKTTSPEAFQAIVDRRRRERMDKIDSFPRDIRECVHDYGNNVVTACMELGIRKAKHIRHLVETVLNEFSPTRGATSNQGTVRAVGFDTPSNDDGTKTQSSPEPNPSTRSAS
jgi:urocanate hydratase